jgi:hypothetical protein
MGEARRRRLSGVTRPPKFYVWSEDLDDGAKEQVCGVSFATAEQAERAMASFARTDADGAFRYFISTKGRKLRDDEIGGYVMVPKGH